MKKILFLSLCFFVLASISFAKQKFVAVENASSHDTAEVNYYLSKGAKVINIVTSACTGCVYCYVLMDVPEGIPDYKK